MTEIDFQAAFAALHALKNSAEQLVINQAIKIAKLEAELAALKVPISPPSAAESAGVNGNE